jgi:branched-chain amino acid transport system substrate-binding protein
MPTDDKLFGKGRIRDDGSVIHPIYLYQVKSPEESKGEWDYFNWSRLCRARRHSGG